MNSIAIFDVARSHFDPTNIIDAHYRNAIAFAKELGIDCIMRREDYTINTIYNIIIFNYASLYQDVNFYKYILELNPKAIIIWLTNEWDLKPNSVIHNRINYVITNNLKKYNYPNFIEAIYANINLLIYKETNELTPKKYDCIYYGSFRKDRKQYFTEYLQNDVYLSTSAKNFKKYKHIGCNPKYINKLSWHDKKETLNNFRYSLYIEDVFSHNIYTHFANRWYEAGFCNNVVFFDRNCINTINKSEIASYINEIEFYIVGSYAELQAKIKECNKDFEYHLNVQKKWRANELQERSNMLKQLKEIIYGLNAQQTELTT